MVTINGYELLEKIGEGGMASVWKARQLSLDRIVAIKVLGKSSLPDQEARDRFRREAQIAAKLNHAGIVQVIDTGEVDDSAYLVMEYIDGPSAGDLIQRQVVMGEEQALEITEHVARALAYAWEKECLIHCDIKPDNILIDRVSGAVKVADLGLARMIGWRPDQADDHLIIGTPNYTPPEQAAGLPDLDCRTDMYALGATLYHMVTGVLPFRDARGSEAMNRHENDFLEDPVVINPALAPATAWLIEKLMIKNRSMRPHFWTQVIKDIEQVRKHRMPFAPLPEAGLSTIRRAPSRAAVSPAAATSPGAVKPPAEPRKLTLKKNDLPSPVAAAPSSRGGGIGKMLVALLVLGFLGYGALVYLGRLPLPTFLEKTGETVSTDEPPAEALAPDPELPPPAEAPPEAWRNEDFIRGARLFNQALADYKEYQQTRENPAILRQVEENCREAIALFEAARTDAPPHIPIGHYIDQCNGLIFNVRQSMTLSPDHDAPEAAASASPEPEAPERRELVYVDDAQEPSSEPVASEPSEPKLLRVAFDAQWDRAPSDAGRIGDELRRLLSRHAEPDRSLMVDGSVPLYPGITCMMSAREAARVLRQELPMRRALEVPGWPARSLFTYAFEGDFSGAQRLLLIVDNNSRVLALQLVDERPAPARMESALFSPNWQVVDFLAGRRRGEADGLIAHRVRKRESLIRLDTELAAPAAEQGERLVATRVQLLMPTQLAGMILSIGN